MQIHVVNVFMQVTGEDVSPGVKRGGWVNLVQRTVSVSCPGDAVLPSIEVSIDDTRTLFAHICGATGVCPAVLILVGTPQFPACSHALATRLAAVVPRAMQ